MSISFELRDCRGPALWRTFLTFSQVCLTCVLRSLGKVVLQNPSLDALKAVLSQGGRVTSSYHSTLGATCSTYLKTGFSTNKSC